jgi:hypothetical protein
MIKLLGGTKAEIPHVYHDRSPVCFSARIETVIGEFGADEGAIDGLIMFPIGSSRR